LVTVTLRCPWAPLATETTTVSLVALFHVTELTVIPVPEKGRGQANQSIVSPGTGFVNGAIVSFSGTGITVNSVTWNSATKLTVVVSVASGASTGNRKRDRDQPGSGLVHG